MKFYGYERSDGSVGVRNKVAILPTVGCVNEAAKRIADSIEGAVAILHSKGCPHLSPDIERTERTLIGLGRNPNIAAVVLLNLGCECVDTDKIADGIAESGKSIEKLASLQELGGMTKLVERGVEVSMDMAMEASKMNRREFDSSALVLGTKCGASDTTSGLSSNPTVGKVADILIEEGGSFIMGEVPDIMGSENILAERATDKETAQRIIETVKDLEKRSKCTVDSSVMGAQITSGHIKGGLTTVSEKSLGATKKGGSKPVTGFIKYGEKPPREGLYFMPTPGHGFENLTGLAAGGAQIILFTTGIGAPEGHPVSPVIKITGNKHTFKHLREHMDFDVSGILGGTETVEEAAEKLYNEVHQVASGKLTRAEILKYDQFMDILTLGPTI